MVYNFTMWTNEKASTGNKPSAKRFVPIRHKGAQPIMTCECRLYVVYCTAFNEYMSSLCPYVTVRVQTFFFHYYSPQGKPCVPHVPAMPEKQPVREGWRTLKISLPAVLPVGEIAKTLLAAGRTHPKPQSRHRRSSDSLHVARRSQQVIMILLPGTLHSIGQTSTNERLEKIIFSNENLCDIYFYDNFLQLLEICKVIIK